MIKKTALHADDRLKERTTLSPSVLRRLRRRVGVVSLPSGTLHARLGGQGYAVLKDLGGRHVVATVLSRHMRPPGRDVTEKLMFNRPFDKLAGFNAQKLLQLVRVPWDNSFEMVMKADPKRGIPERVVGSIHPDYQGIVHASNIDPVLQGTGLAETAYKRMAQQMPGGVIAGDWQQSRGSFPLWKRMVDKAMVSAARAEAAGKPLDSVIQGVPLSAGYASSSAFMSPPKVVPTFQPGANGVSNFILRMPAKAVRNPDPYPGSLPLQMLWPTSAGSPEARAFAESGFPWGSGVRSWEGNAARTRAARGQPEFPAPNRKGTFSEFVREADLSYGPTRRTGVVAPVAQGPSAMQQTVESLKRRFADRNPFAGVLPEEFQKELAAAKGRLLGSRSGPAPFSALEPVYGGRAGGGVSGFVVRPREEVAADVRAIASKEQAAKQLAASKKQQYQQNLQQQQLTAKGKSPKPVEPPAELLGAPEPGAQPSAPVLRLPAPSGPPPRASATPTAPSAPPAPPAQQGGSATPGLVDAWMNAPRIRALKDAWFAAGKQ